MFQRLKGPLELCATDHYLAVRDLSLSLSPSTLSLLVQLHRLMTHVAMSPNPEIMMLNKRDNEQNLVELDEALEVLRLRRDDGMSVSKFATCKYNGKTYQSVAHNPSSERDAVIGYDGAENRFYGRIQYFLAVPLAGDRQMYVARVEWYRPHDHNKGYILKTPANLPGIPKFIPMASISCKAALLPRPKRVQQHSVLELL